MRPVFQIVHLVLMFATAPALGQITGRAVVDTERDIFRKLPAVTADVQGALANPKGVYDPAWFGVARGLGNVVIAIKSPPEMPTRRVAAAPVEVRLFRCMYEPHVVTLRPGQELVF